MTTDPAPPDRPNVDNGGDEKYRVLSARAIWWAAGVIMAIGVGAAAWLVLAYGHGDEHARNLSEAIRTVGTIMVGAGGGAALLLAARRQRAAEITLKQKERDQLHQERVAAATEADAAARRITDLYTKAVEQLGAAKAPVRLGGLYALERLAQDNPNQRQTIINMLCAYLRMPYQPPGDPPPDDADDPITVKYLEQVQELEVRLTAQRLIADHLQPGQDGHEPAVTFWSDIDLDLTGATLIDLDLDRCAMRKAIFRNVQFGGKVWFGSARFDGSASFSGARFGGYALFDHAQFSDRVSFDEATFIGSALFKHVLFGNDASFRKTHFGTDAHFEGARFARYASFEQAEFGGDSTFGAAQFSGWTRFTGVRFRGTVWFTIDCIYFINGVHGSGARFIAPMFADGVPAELAQFLQEPGSDDIHLVRSAKGQRGAVAPTRTDSVEGVGGQSASTRG